MISHLIDFVEKRASGDLTEPDELKNRPGHAKVEEDSQANKVELFNHLRSSLQARRNALEDD